MSLEIFISIAIAVYVVKVEKRPDATTLAAAGLATFGVVLVSFT